MDTNLIYQFRTVFESGTISRAAEHLHITPGALSRAMKRLEKEIDCALFNPSGRNVVPTQQAKKFYISSTEIIQAIEKAKENVKNKSIEVKELRIATFEVFSTHFMAWMIEKHFSDFPVNLIESTPGHIEKHILNGQADFGLTYVPELHPELDHLMIGEMQLGVFASKKGKTKDLPYAIPITELGINYLRAKSLDGWPADIPRKVQFKFEMLETALDLTSRGIARILCPKFIIRIENERLNDNYKLHEQEQQIRLPKLKVYSVKKKSHPEDEFFKKLCMAVRLTIKN